MTEAGQLTVVIAGGVRDEVQHPRTPADVKRGVLPRIFNLRPGLNTQQQAERQRVALILQGNAKSSTRSRRLAFVRGGRNRMRLLHYA
jgi:hypothetical protein